MFKILRSAVMAGFTIGLAGFGYLSMINMLHGLKPSGDEYSGGTIYDPGNGKTYYCSFKVDGNTLHVRGSLDKRGFLGRTMDWFRVK